MLGIIIWPAKADLSYVTSESQTGAALRCSTVA